MEAVIQVKNLTKEYPHLKAVDSIDFEIMRGSVHAFLGPNGAGKSTTIKMLAGLLQPTAGEIKLNGTDLKNQIDPKVVGVLAENPPLYYEMKVLDYLMYVTRLRGFSKKEARLLCDEAIEKLRLAEVKNRLIRNISKGYKQKVAIAQAIVHRPSIIILDEPTVGLDPNAILEIRELLFCLKENHTIFLSTHQLTEIEKSCDAVTILNKGKIIETGKMDELYLKYAVHNIFHVEMDIDQRALEELKALFDIKVTRYNDLTYRLVSTHGEDISSNISAFVINNGGSLYALSKEKIGLEEIFLGLQGESHL